MAVGDNGTMLRSSDWITWDALKSVTTNDLNAIDMPFGDIVIVGDAGTILFSTNGGDSFGTETSGTVADLNGVAFDGNRIVAVGQGGTIVSTGSVSVGNSGFFTWTPRASGTLEDLKTVLGLSGGGFIAAGTNGIVLWSGDGVEWFEVFPNNNIPG